jgi:hypothetical protein
MNAFSKKLEEHCNEAMRKHAKKLRPNYGKTWLVSLQTQLSLIDK